ncbi:MAG: SUMF1/EgtB/PvdO family nonheme iron enzyme [Myxococcota bacterium]|nr:SUMF1/EgtB/PvdO family nonheme iron enzyme [Myxococcota bacterium]
MATRRVDGTALLVAGVGLPSTATLDASAVHTLGQIGESLLATGAAWQIRRLTATSGERYAADRATLKRHVDELVAEPARVAIVALLGSIVQTKQGPALVTGAQPLEYPDDATLPLAWIRDRLLAAKVEQLVVVLSAIGDGVPRGWLDALGTEKKTHIVAIEKPTDRHPTIDALLTGLCGDALDPRTGTVTMASLSDHLARVENIELQFSTASETIAQPPPLAGLWDVRRSQLAHRAPRKPSEDDLTGSVLPGRFRLDRLVARGTFGTVYRARQLAVERDVAIKVLHADIDPSSEDGRLFVHEIRSVGRIDHTSVVRIHQADITHDGRLFFAMELLDGEDLQSLGAKAPLPREQVVELGRQLLEGLSAAHDAGLVHADVKPANAILVPELRSQSGRPQHDRLVLVDFGLSRLRAPDKPTASAGGTPAYMAPEQLHEGRVDARSDLFSAALVLVYLLTGWRRPNAFTLVPPLESIADPDLRAVLARALETDPSKRYQSARELAAALTGIAVPAPSTTPPTPILPFRHLAPLTENDRDRLYGRESDLADLAEAVLYRRSVIYTAPSGTGKTSLLRAGLLPRLEALGVRAIYLRCRADCTRALANEIHPGAETIGAAIAAWHEQGGGKLVLVLDQLETALSDPDFLATVLAFDHFPAGADVSVVLSVREDYLARLVARTQSLEPNIQLLRLPPLAPAGARAAIVGPLTEARLAIEPDLLDTLLDDLVRAAAAIGPEMGWGNARAVYPPHLQLACSVLYEALGSGEATITLAHYRALGGFDAIVGEHLDRVLDTELADGRAVIARDLFVALVTTANERAVRTESELLAMVSAHPPDRVTAVLELLRSRGLLVRVRGDSEPSWELIHDSLVRRVLAWVDRRDLARRRAIELVRYHLRRSRPDVPSLLGRAELRELRPHTSALAELDAEWKKRSGTTELDWTPARLVARSHAVLRRRTLTFSTIILAALALASVGFYQSHRDGARAREEARLKSLDLGRFTLSLEPFDWDPAAQRATPVSASTLTLDWKLHVPDAADPTQPGPPLDPVVHSERRFVDNAVLEAVEARGGRAFVVVTRGPCSPSVIPIKQLPGYTSREDAPVRIALAVPTCAATRAGMIDIAAGPFIYGGVGEPPSPYLQSPEMSEYAREDTRNQPAFLIDRTEVTNAAFTVFSKMSAITGHAHPDYPVTKELGLAGGPEMPVSNIDWNDARAFCRFLGKELPSSEQWVRALRGGRSLRDGSQNPWPRRNFPWGLAPQQDDAANVKRPRTSGPARVGSFPADVSPDGVADLAGNVSEWTSSRPPKGGDGMRMMRGGNYGETDAKALVDFMAIENLRPIVERTFTMGVRCAALSR